MPAAAVAAFRSSTAFAGDCCRQPALLWLHHTTGMASFCCCSVCCSCQACCCGWEQLLYLQQCCLQVCVEAGLYDRAESPCMAGGCPVCSWCQSCKQQHSHKTNRMLMSLNLLFVASATCDACCCLDRCFVRINISSPIQLLLL
jgi:hypothetical protein